jgi:hypothetical protein
MASENDAFSLPPDSNTMNPNVAEPETFSNNDDYEEYNNENQNQNVEEEGDYPLLIGSGEQYPTDLLLQWGGADENSSEDEAEEDEDYIHNFEIENKDADAIVNEDDEYTFTVAESQKPVNEEESDSSDDEDIVNPETVQPVPVEIPVVKNVVTMEETQGEELIMDFEVEDEPENILVIDEALIPEDKVIATDKQQADDIFNQMIKMSDKIDKKIISHKKKIIKNFELLKKMYSVFDESGNILSEKLKTDTYKPIKQLLDSDIYNPIVNESKGIYNPILNEEDEDIEIEDDENAGNFLEDRKKYHEIETKYTVGSNRTNYSFMSHINELFNLVEEYQPEEPGFVSTASKDTEVISNTFTNEVVSFGGNILDFNKHRVSGPMVFAGKEYVKGTALRIIGYLQQPDAQKQFSKLFEKKQKLAEVIDNNLNSGYKYSSENINVNRVRNELQIGDVVYICKTKKSGQIQEIKEDGSLIIDNKSYLPEDISVIPCDSTNERVAYLFENVDENKNIDDYLDQIIPSVRNLVDSFDKKDIRSILELETFLDKYNLSLDDLTNNNIKDLVKLIDSNNKKLKPTKTDYEKYSKTDYKQRRDNYMFMSNKILDELREFYGEYPYFNSKNDSQEKRFAFVTGQVDKGALYFFTMVRKIEDILSTNKQNRIYALSRRRLALEQEQNMLKEELNKDYNSGFCAEKRVTNIYYSLSDLEKTNGTKIKKDTDRIHHGDKTEYVESNNYAILVYPNGKKDIYSRDTEDNYWDLVNEDIQSELMDDEEFCNSNGFPLSLLKNSEYPVYTCMYSKEHKKCMDIRYLKAENELKSIKEQLVSVNKQLNILENLEEYLLKRSREMEKMKSELELEFAKKLREEKHFAKLYVQIQDDVDTTYADFYGKIDKYLENISILSQEDYYLGLKTLLDKYGRKAFENENEHNTYCIMGNKILACNHHKLFINFYQGMINSSELLESVQSRYGVEHDGFVWCNNCGQEMNLSEYETIEGFNDAGARIITHEVVEDEGATGNENSENDSELLKTLKNMLLQGDDKSIKNTDTRNVSVVKITEVLCDIMGIKLTKNDHYNLLKHIEGIPIRSKEQYLDDAKKSQKWKQALKAGVEKKLLKQLELAYVNFYNRNVILNTSAVLFMIIQSSIPSYNNLRNHKSCNPSLSGYPLNEDNQHGIDYISCVLDKLKESGNEWLYIKKINVKEELIKLVDKFIKDELFVYLYEKKRVYLESIEISKIIHHGVSWNTFKPPLFEYKINQSDLAITNLTENNVNEKETKLTLKFIELLNKTIGNSDIENAKYIPTPVDNFCCLEDVTNSNYLSYFIDRDPTIKTIYKNLVKINKAKKQLIKPSVKISMKPNPKVRAESFTNIIFDEENITQNDIDSFFNMYIAEGPYKGRKYIFDQYGICQISGLNKNEIAEKTYNKNQYLELNKFIRTQERLYIDNKTEKFTSMLFESFVEKNSVFRNNSFINELIEKLNKKTKMEDIIKEIRAEIKIETKELVELLDRKLTVNTIELSDILSNIGELKQIFEENKEILGFKKAQVEYFTRKTQLIKLFLINSIKLPFQRISNEYSSVDVSLNTNWRIDQDMEFKLTDILVENYDISERYSYIPKPLIDSVLGTLRNSMKNMERLRGPEVMSELMHYIFVHIISKVCNEQANDIDLNIDIDVDNEEDEELDITRNIEAKNYVILKIIYDMLLNIGKIQEKMDKYTKAQIQSSIEQKAENDKESNLRFIQELDRETWTSLKNMIALGMDSWKNLSQKDRNLYIPDNQQENSEDLLQTEDEQAYNLQNKAIEELGSNYSPEQYQEWLDNRNHNAREDRLAYEERDILPDLDHDD